MTHTNELDGKCALVTGSTSGIGLGIAKALAAQGANVMVTGLGSEELIEQAMADIRSNSRGQVEFCHADLRQPDQIEHLVGHTQDILGSLDILVNNAGIQFVSPIQDFPVDKWNDIIAINMSAAFHTIRLSTPIMLDAGWGRIVNIASLHALVASPFKAAYVTAKHGVAGLTKVVALELATRNITVNAIAPGYVLTPLVTGQIADTARVRGLTEEQVVSDVMLAAQPTKQFVTIEQIAGLTLFLCSDVAASITGSVVPIDGGWSAQ